MEVLKQPQYAPLPVERQVLLIFAGTRGFLDNVAEDDVAAFEPELYRFMETRHADAVARLVADKAMSKELEGAIEAAVREFSEQFVAARQGAAA